MLTRVISMMGYERHVNFDSFKKQRLAVSNKRRINISLSMDVLGR